jgi:hypothetical protein
MAEVIEQRKSDEEWIDAKATARILGYADRAFHNPDLRRRLGLQTFQLPTGGIRFRKSDVLKLVQPIED